MRGGEDAVDAQREEDFMIFAEMADDLKEKWGDGFSAFFDSLWPSIVGEE